MTVRKNTKAVRSPEPDLPRQPVLRTQYTSRHLVADIHGAIDACLRGDETVLALLDMPDFETALKDLREMIQDGYDVVPSADCDNQSYTGRCLGHVVWKAGEL